ncbi:MAG: general secretion pathway protein GspK [bacterium]
MNNKTTYTRFASEANTSPHSKLRNRRLDCELGSFSITALWVLAILSLLSVSFARDILLAFRFENYALQASRAEWLARSGVYHALAVLQADAAQDSLRPYDAFTETWAHRPETFKDIALGQGYFEVSYKNTDEPNVIYGVMDENRKINLNRAQPEALLRLPGMTGEKLAALLDWIDPDDRARPNGAERTFYAALNPPYDCKNAALTTLDELILIRGFSREDIRNWQSLATVYGDGSVNINTAPANVLKLLGMPESLTEKIIAARWGADGIAFTPDDFVFDSPALIPQKLKQRQKLSLGEQVILNRLTTTKMLDVRSTHFKIDAYGVTMNGQIQRKATAFAQRAATGEMQILGWQEGGQ